MALRQPHARFRVSIIGPVVEPVASGDIAVAELLTKQIDQGSHRRQQTLARREDGANYPALRRPAAINSTSRPAARSLRTTTLGRWAPVVWRGSATTPFWLRSSENTVLALAAMPFR